jgi:beta-glucosidase
MAGVDQFGGNNQIGPVIEAYQMGVKDLGENKMRARFEESAVRLLINIFQVGLFENPYLEVEKSSKIVGNPNFMKMGYEAQLKSIVMLKNKSNVLPFKKDVTVYIPKKYVPPRRSFMGGMSEGGWEDPLNLDIVKKYVNVTDNPRKADVAIVCIDSPDSGGGYMIEDAKSGEGNGYFPISLQYNPYTADLARDPSIAGGDPLEILVNRSYKGKSIEAANKKDLDVILDTKKAIGKKPVIVIMNISNPTVVSEFEREVDGILGHFGVQNQAILDIISGAVEPSALLPLQMPADMNAVETQLEDVPLDLNCHIDTEGNGYDFGFGLNWSGVIKDDRTAKYRKN